MIVLDTNIVSAAMSEGRHPATAPARAWLAAQRPPEVFVTTVTVAEVWVGVEALPDGRKKALLRDAATRFFAAMEPNLLDFTRAAAVEYAHAISARRKLGRPISVLDAQIAAIALAAQATLATRNTKDFDGIGLALVNPYGGD